ncbi:hypothetical protein Ssi03_50510 [Sphaerisporangium siamense]|uniref:Uncharacterized protein n=1 Tax=Sphaerisporangium siamense TaxID=795645 RepID=A0A7W7DA86_9ACTN|nr:hypothetical protein [Sphaerisporangium siamense]MBB4702245.1 hypothetical protein [Sphaerisporangium siamense]GII87061.1 hypothetical protein Ssi03_50510 [Sphaerisporangium siamense]
MATYGIQSPSPNGVTLTFRSAASSDKISGLRTKAGRILVNNASGASVNLTFSPPGNTGYGVANPTKVVACAAGQITEITLLPEYRDATDGYNIALAWSATSSVTWAAIR